MADAHYSFAIVGAGPAGATCANALLRAGAEGVALIDKARFPRDKACGDGLGPGVIPILDELGLHHVLKEHRRITRMSMSSPYGSQMQLDTDLYSRRSPLGYVIPRLKFDHALVTAALGRGAMDMMGWGLESADFSNGRWQLELLCAETGQRRSLRADVLISRSSRSTSAPTANAKRARSGLPSV